jgi:gamma-glutamyltranspeptidase/glutathione hydrolase
MVSSTHWLASQIGMSMLEKGGNSFDAAAAIGFALQVIEPHMYGPCGEVVILFQTPGQQTRVICGQGVAPARATIAHYRREGLDLVPGTGLLAAVVPGAFDAWLLMLRDHGTMALSEVMAPAIAYADNGYPVTFGIAATIADVEQLLRNEWTSSAAIYLPNGNVPRPGDLLANRLLARTFLRILSEAEAAGGSRERKIEAARQAFYRGFVAEAIETFATGTEVLDTSGERHRGVLTATDLAAWSASYEEPVSYDYRGLTLCKAGPWSQGPVFLQTLALLDGLDVAAMDPAGPEFVHTLVEAMKLAFADRDAWYGDVNFVDVPMTALLSEQYNSARRKLIGDVASSEIRPGSPDGRRPRLAARTLAAVHKLTGPQADAASRAFDEDVGPRGHVPDVYVRPHEIGATAPRSSASHIPAHGDTCHFDVIDQQGNFVSATPSGGWLQQSPVIPGLGFCLNTRAQGFWLEQGLPSSLAPGRRPRTTLSPTLALRDGQTVFAFGSTGADYQDQWIVQFFLRLSQHDMNLQAAIDAPTVQTEHIVNSVYPRALGSGNCIMEDRFPAATISELERRGHNVKLAGAWSSFGRVCAAAKRRQLLEGAATPRLQQAYAVGR